MQRHLHSHSVRCDGAQTGECTLFLRCGQLAAGHLPGKQCNTNAEVLCKHLASLN